MKVQVLIDALSEVPSLLRESAQALRRAQVNTDKLEKIAALRKVGQAFGYEESEEDPEYDLALEKVASRVAPRYPLGEVSEDLGRFSNRGNTDIDFLDRVRGI